MDTNQTKINYKQELATLKDAELYWKPSEGRHKLTLKSEPRETQYTDKEGKINPQWQFDVELLESPDGKGKRIWNIPKSIKPTSLRGQLVKIGDARGKLMDETINIGVQGTKKDKRYTVIEAL